MDTNSRHDKPDGTSGSVYRDLLTEVDAMFDDDLEQATIDSKTDVDRANARLLVLTNELDRRGVTETVHVLSTTAWLRSTCRIHRYWLDHNDTVETSGGEKPHITVTVDYEILTGTKNQLPELDGHAVDPETIRRWACDAGIVRIITTGDSQPIDVGRRTRTIPPALRRALELRDGGCVWPGCGAPIAWCDVHHIVHWADGGETSLENCQLLCRKHHSVTHKRRRPGPVSDSNKTNHQHRGQTPTPATSMRHPMPNANPKLDLPSTAET